MIGRKQFLCIVLAAGLIAAETGAAEMKTTGKTEASAKTEKPKEDGSSLALDLDGSGLVIVDGEEDLSDNATIKRPENYQDPTYYDQVILIGDSRTVGLSQVCAGPQGVTIIWSCKGAMGYDWMVSTGIPQIESYVGDNTAIVILMGVNDVYNIGNYINYMNDKAIDWDVRGADTYFCTVGPVDGQSLYVNNDQVIAFNMSLTKGLSSDVRVIDLYNHMVTDGYATFDGIHYSIDTDHDMFQYILDNLVNDNGGVPGSIW